MKFLDLKTDFAFKKVFGSKERLIYFLKAGAKLSFIEEVTNLTKKRDRNN